MSAAFAEPRRIYRSRPHPLTQMPEEDLDFAMQFVLASGSLKDMARLHQVSYPTIRAALDKVIDHLRQGLSGAPPDPMTELLADLVERGEIKAGTAKNIRAAHRKALERLADREELR